MVRKQNQKQKIGSKKAVFKFVSNAANRGIIKKKKKNIPHTKNPNEYKLPVFSFNNIEDFYKEYPKDIKGNKQFLKKITKEAKEAKKFKRHYREEKLTLKEVDKRYKLSQVERRSYKVKIRKGKNIGKFRTVEIEKIVIPSKQFYGCEKIRTNKGDIFYLKYEDEATKRRALRILLKHYDFDSFKVLEGDRQAYSDLKGKKYISKNIKFDMGLLKRYKKYYKPKSVKVSRWRKR